MTIDGAGRLDPEVAEVLAMVPAGAFDFGAWTVEGIPEERLAFDVPAPELPPTTTVSYETTVDNPAGGHRPGVRVYAPPVAAPDRPCVIWIHGGGYIFGSGLTPDRRLNEWVEKLGCVVVSVDYRIAPEDPYPAGLEDCHAALVWVAGHAVELGVDRNRIAVSGASAGGGLAAALALLARDRGEVALAFQLLIYPMIDDRQTTPSSRNEGAPVWNRGANELGWRAYLGAAAGGPDVPAYAAPARAEDLSGLPPTWIGVGALDIFRDEDIAYASRLLAAGVPTELHVLPGVPHGFESIVPTAAVSQRFDLEIVTALGRVGAWRAGA